MLLGFVFGGSLLPHPTVHIEHALSRSALAGYTLSEYLPELHGTRSVQTRQAKPRSDSKPDPGIAKQEIVSLPDTPDNLRQTIIAPPKIKLDAELNLPNVAAYSVPPAQPLAASQQSSVTRRVPALLPNVVPPTVEAAAVRSQSALPRFEPRIVQPAPDVANAHARVTMPNFQTSVVEPAPELGSISKPLSATYANLKQSVAEPISDSPQIPGTSHSSAEIIALNLHPADVRVPVELPSGNRRASFVASPSGRLDGQGSGEPTNTAAGTTLTPNAPAGINVSPAPVASALPVPDGPTPNAVSPGNNTERRLMAMSAPPPNIPSRPSARELTEARTELEKRIFAGRRSYSLLVNTPNLNTTTGSWIIHFAERKPGAIQSPIAAPEVVRKSDPAFPGELIREGVQGIVVLTAIIHSDGSVGEIAIAQSLDPTLDLNAARALSRWIFRPAIRDGQAIELEAVITVPFRTSTRF